eukprot:3654045-Pleurochrysis_carterae.AAC.2
MSRTRLRSRGTSERSIVRQLPLALWSAISARSAAVHPLRSSRSACLRVLGSGDVAESVKAQPEPRHRRSGLCSRAVLAVKSTEGEASRLRNGYAPRPRRKRGDTSALVLGSAVFVLSGDALTECGVTS